MQKTPINPVIAITSPGNMGAAVGARLTANRLRVLTSVHGRGAASRARAEAAGLIAATDDRLAEADFLLSILPPKDAVAIAERLAPALRAAARKPVYVDCNAVSPATVRRIAEVVTATGTPFVDGGIIGGPPREGYAGPKFYVSGPEAERVTELNRFGLVIRVVKGGIGAASALKLAYAGINKGTIALGAAMVLAARRAGVEADLLQELAESQRPFLAQLSRGVPDMFSKAERWAPEMREIADYVERSVEADIYDGMAEFFERLAADFAGGKEEISALDEFFARARKLSG
ncbi:MAG: NAD(P)-dependent oxidoreductase [Bradyrhizobiaceae bacterium]|nr:NAD(P)-dependent oxidoreductase [Bradyrhizobiaceae bacterium]